MFKLLKLGLKLAFAMVCFLIVLVLVTQKDRDTEQNVRLSGNEGSSPRASSSLFSNLFYVKHKTGTRAGTSKVMGFYTNSRDRDELKQHCKKQYRGATWCFYYPKNHGSQLVHLSSLKPFEAVSAAAKTPFVSRVDISVDGNKVHYSTKGH